MYSDDSVHDADMMDDGGHFDDADNDQPVPENEVKSKVLKKC